MISRQHKHTLMIAMFIDGEILHPHQIIAQKAMEAYEEGEAPVWLQTIANTLIMGKPVADIAALHFCHQYIDSHKSEVSNA